MSEIVLDDNGRRCRCVEAPEGITGTDICRKCALKYADKCIRIECRADHREDGKEVYFVLEDDTDGPGI